MKPWEKVVLKIIVVPLSQTNCNSLTKVLQKVKLCQATEVHACRDLIVYVCLPSNAPSCVNLHP